MFTVFESTLVVVPCTVRLPTTIAFPATEILSPSYVIADDETTPLKFAANILLEPKLTSLANEIAFPSEDRMFLPAAICTGASNSMLPVPVAVSVISPFTDSNVIVSLPVSKIFTDSPASVLNVKSVPSVDNT
jgi:hypothetical protein